MKWLISEVSVCDYGDDEPGSCLADKTNNTSADAEDHVVTRCNGCGRTHNCAVISMARLDLKDGVRLTYGTSPAPAKKSNKPTKRAALKKPIPKKK